MLLVPLFAFVKKPRIYAPRSAKGGLGVKEKEKTMKTILNLFAEALKFALGVAIAAMTLHAACACGPMEPDPTPAPDANMADMGNEADDAGAPNGDAGANEDAATLADASTPDADAPDAFVCEIPDGYGNGTWVKCFDSQVLCQLTWDVTTCRAGCYEEDGDPIFRTGSVHLVLDRCTPSSPPPN